MAQFSPIFFTVGPSHRCADGYVTEHYWIITWWFIVDVFILKLKNFLVSVGGADEMWSRDLEAILSEEDSSWWRHFRWRTTRMRKAKPLRVGQSGSTTNRIKQFSLTCNHRRFLRICYHEQRHVIDESCHEY